MKDKILSELFTSKEFHLAINKMEPECYREDLKQEVFLVLCSTDSQKILQLHESKQLKFYATRIMLNMIQSKTSRFFYSFRKNTPVELSNNLPIKDEQYDTSIDDTINKVEESIDELSWYKKELFKLYVEYNCNASKLSRETRIPIRSIYQTIKEIKKEIKTKL